MNRVDHLSSSQDHWDFRLCLRYMRKHCAWISLYLFHYILSYRWLAGLGRVRTCDCRNASNPPLSRTLSYSMPQLRRGWLCPRTVLRTTAESGIQAYPFCWCLSKSLSLSTTHRNLFVFFLVIPDGLKFRQVSIYYCSTQRSTMKFTQNTVKDIVLNNAVFEILFQSRYVEGWL